MKLLTLVMFGLLLLAAMPRASMAQGTVRDVTSEASDAPRRSIDSTTIRLVAGEVLPQETVARQAYLTAVERATRVLFAWLTLVLAYLASAIHRYVYNYGLSNREWKVLYPEVYATRFDDFLASIPWLKIRSYRDRRDELEAYRQRQRAAAGDELIALPAQSITKLLDEPDKNPYQGDSFGLPPGTIRGIIALTAIVLFGLIEYVNLYSGAMEQQFAGVVLALQMILAFYFGSRAVEVFKAAEAKQKAEPSARARTSPATANQPATRETAAEPSAREPAPAPERVAAKTALPENKTVARFASFVAGARSNGHGTSALVAAAAQLTAATPLERRVLALTAAFETGSRGADGFGALSGDFDDQGISFGALQWNIGQRSVQPLWRAMVANHPDRTREILGPQFDEFRRMFGDEKKLDEQLRWARSIQHMAASRANAWAIIEPWKTRLQALGRCEEMMDIQVEAARSLYLAALAFCGDYDLVSERGAALMFDIAVQNGSVDRDGSGARIRDDFQLINPTLSEEEQEVERMRIIAHRRAEVARKQWQADVLGRKTTIAEGTGIVHGRRYDLEADFAITLSPLPALV